jgi:hypothetical protein
MNFSLKPNPLIAVWVPGFASLSAFLYLGWHEKVACLVHHPPSSALIGAFGFVMVVFAFVVGDLLDAIRDFTEYFCDRFFPKHSIKWNFFVAGKKEKVENLEEWFYTWYELDANLAIGILILLILSLFPIMPIPLWLTITLFIMMFIFGLSALLMRNEVKKEIETNYW